MGGGWRSRARPWSQKGHGSQQPRRLAWSDSAMSDAEQGSAAASVERFLGYLDSGDHAAWWGAIDDNFRLCQVELYLWQHRDELEGLAEALPDLAVGMAAEGSRHPLAQPFIELQLALLTEHWALELKRWREGHMSVVEGLHLFGPDLEHVYLLSPSDGEEPLTLTFVMRHVNGAWKVAAYGEEVPTPGWPPT